MSSQPQDIDTPISVVRDVVIEFMNAMLNERYGIEQQIKEKAEEIRTQFSQLGQSTYSYADIDRLMQSYKEFFVTYYKNTIHLRLVTAATKTITSGIHRGLSMQDVIREELLEELKNLQHLASSQSEMDARSLDLEQSLLEQTETYSEIQSENIRLHNDIQALELQLKEKDNEVENMAQSLIQMENQVNMLGQRMMETQGEIDELQQALARKDQEIALYKSEVAQKTELEGEIENLRHTIQEMARRENELLANQSTTSTQLFDQLQEELEKTRNELYTLKSEQVEKNDQIRRMKLEVEEKIIEKKHLETFKEKAEKDLESMKEQITNLTETNSDFLRRYTELKEKHEKIEGELSGKSQELEEKRGLLEKAESELSQYRDKVAITEEVKESYEKTLDYFMKNLTYDPKFRVLTILEGMDEEVSIEYLTKALGLPSEIVHRSLVELADAMFITLRKEELNYFAKAVNSNKAPFSLKDILAEAGAEE